MRNAEPPVVFLIPILGLPISISIWSDHSPLLLYCVNFKKVIVGDSAKPDIFRAILPIVDRATPLFPFPGNPILDVEIILEYPLYRSEERRVGKECRSRW